MCIYLIDIYYNPKIHLSYILLFIQNKTLESRLLYFKLGSIFLQ